MRLESLLDIINQHHGYLPCSSRSGEYHGSNCMFIRGHNLILRGKKRSHAHFSVWSSLRRGVWRGKITKICLTFWLQRAAKFFLEVKYTCYGYLGGPPRLGLSNAPKIMIVRHIDQKIFSFYEKSGKKPYLRGPFESHFSSFRSMLRFCLQQFVCKLIQ